MGQLSAVLIIPPIVGLVTYVVVRLFWKRDELEIAARRKSRLASILKAPKNECTASIGSRRPPQQEARPRRRAAANGEGLWRLVLVIIVVSAPVLRHGA